MSIHPDAFIHPMALVEGATVGARTRIWQFASVIRGAVIGADCSIASGACIDGSTVGDETVIAHNLAAGPGFQIGSRVFIGPNCTLCNDGWPRAGKTGFNVSAYKDRPAIIIEPDASIGANSVILPGVRIGVGAMIGAGSVVSKDVPACHVWMKHGEMRPITMEDEISRQNRRVRFAA
ncbi:N-acetyltransferase [Henriciella mobilis]|uniref:DapH/DapD/GlmU-related protein n=1 Tax=Henriciella mobilis TaxID=2305467 RepID=UPI000E671FF3|nr:DapH/DapD/GlmU-related protein [Henriciella mobilis]RIJ15959.1 N-acetyltransferase [Henriciella mobilis]RIJ21169.1 N-acetyltransferase [Henriciella mobilis]RIJ23130.1 N-acetyltransferase [Henriciella mobilis]